MAVGAALGGLVGGCRVVLESLEGGFRCGSGWSGGWWSVCSEFGVFCESDVLLDSGDSG